MAARGPPGAAMAAPEPGRCAHFVQRKGRFCRMVPAAGRRFCGEHGHEEVRGPFPGRERGREGGRARGGLAVAAGVGEAASMPSLEPLCAGHSLQPSSSAALASGVHSDRIQSSIKVSSQFLRSGLLTYSE